MKQSAGILLFRRPGRVVEFFLVHPGGPFWKNKDEGAWSVPKGEFENEDPLVAAKREFMEETGVTCEGDFIPLGDTKLKSGKKISAWALEKDLDPGIIASNYFEMEWPPKSRKLQSFPEVDRGAWFTENQAKRKINPAQAIFIERLREKLGIE